MIIIVTDPKPDSDLLHDLSSLSLPWSERLISFDESAESFRNDFRVDEGQRLHLQDFEIDAEGVTFWYRRPSYVGIFDNGLDGIKDLYEAYEAVIKRADKAHRLYPPLKLLEEPDNKRDQLALAESIGLNVPEFFIVDTLLDESVQDLRTFMLGLESQGFECIYKGLYQEVYGHIDRIHAKKIKSEELSPEKTLDKRIYQKYVDGIDVRAVIIPRAGTSSFFVKWYATQVEKSGGVIDVEAYEMSDRKTFEVQPPDQVVCLTSEFVDQYCNFGTLDFVVEDGRFAHADAWNFLEANVTGNFTHLDPQLLKLMVTGLLGDLSRLNT